MNDVYQAVDKVVKSYHKLHGNYAGAVGYLQVMVESLGTRLPEREKKQLCELLIERAEENEKILFVDSLKGSK